MSTSFLRLRDDPNVQSPSKYLVICVAVFEACVMLMCTGILMCGFGIMGFTSVASGKPKFLLIVSTCLSFQVIE